MFLSKMRKKKLLFASEASFLNSGYGTLYHNLLKRIYSNYGDRFEIAELASYASPADPRCGTVPWTIYPVVPHENDHESKRIYESDKINEFGRYLWEKVCLDYEPDICCAMRDPWYEKHQVYSPFRHIYNLVWKPTVDAFPLNEEWLSDFSLCDAVLTYTDWAAQVIEYQAGDKINLKGAARPGVDTDIFFPVKHKAKLKESVGLNQDTLVIGMVARNQMRKLFPDLIQAFAKFLVEGPKEITSRVVLYLHTAWPDLGWDIPLLLKEFGVGNRVMFTYICRNQQCNNIFSSFFQDARSFCKKCGEYSASLTNSQSGVTNEILNNVYNMFDVYVQLACAGGLELPAVEACAAGVATMVSDYAGMEDIINKLGAFPINTKKFNREVSTGRYMAMPDLDDMLQKLTALLLAPDSVRRSYGFKSRLAAKQEFNWDTTTAKWVDVLDSLPYADWKQPIKFIKNAKPPENLNNEQFVQWCFVNILGRPDLINSYMYLRTIRDLNWGHFTPGNTMNGLYFSEENVMTMKPQFQPFDRQVCLREFSQMQDNFNQWENQRKLKFKL